MATPQRHRRRHHRRHPPRALPAHPARRLARRRPHARRHRPHRRSPRHHQSRTPPGTRPAGHPLPPHHQRRRPRHRLPRTPLGRILAGLDPYLRRDSAERPRIDNQFRLDLDPSVTGTAYVQNAELHTHGIGTPDLGLAAWRSATILNSLTGKDLYPSHTAPPSPPSDSSSNHTSHPPARSTPSRPSSTDADNTRQRRRRKPPPTPLTHPCRTPQAPAGPRLPP